MIHRTEDGHAIIACRAPKVASCDFCRWNHVALCDAPSSSRPGKTCDAKMCPIHRHTVGPNIDHCPNHVKTAVRQTNLLESES